MDRDKKELIAKRAEALREINEEYEEDLEKAQQVLTASKENEEFWDMAESVIEGSPNPEMNMEGHPVLESLKSTMREMLSHITVRVALIGNQRKLIEKMGKFKELPDGSKSEWERRKKAELENWCVVINDINREIGEVKSGGQLKAIIRRFKEFNTLVDREFYNVSVGVFGAIRKDSIAKLEQELAKMREEMASRAKKKSREVV
jgi:hypothetical protein